MNILFRFGWKVLVILCLVIALPLAAQDAATQTVDLGDGYSINVPADWSVEQDDGVFTLKDDEISLEVFTPTYLSTLGVEIESDPVAALITLKDAIRDTQIARDEIGVTIYNGQVAASYRAGNRRSIEQIDVAFELNDGTVGYLIFSTSSGALAVNAVLIRGIIESFASDADAPPSAPEETTGTTETAAVVECTVSADGADTAQLRVGPGTNRGAISFLPVDTDVTVTGRIELDNGDVWYQLDKSEAAPDGTAASELWVSAEQVDTSGDCDQVGETSAPPVIPIVAAPPTQTTGGGGSATPQAGLITPNQGTWIMTLDPITNNSCEGYENERYPSTEFYDTLTIVFGIGTIDRDSFVAWDDQVVYTRIPGTNTFYGSVVFEGNWNGQIRFTAISPTSMTGSTVGNNIFDGLACSATTLFVATHQ